MLIIALIGLIVLVVIVVVIIVVVSASRNKKNQWGANDGTIYQNGGMNLSGDIRNSYFNGRPADQSTYIVSKDKQVAYGNSNIIRNITIVNMTNNQSFSVAFREKMYIGRIAEPGISNKLSFPEDVKMSKDHCMITEFNGMLYVQDLNSTNHTYVDNVLVADVLALSSGSVIRAGNTYLQIIY